MWEIHILDLGRFKTDKSTLTYLEGFGQEVNCCCLAFLINGPKKVLVDTGIGDLQSAQNINKTIFQTKEQTLKSNLEKFGISYKDIDLIIFTHLHFDHFGGNEFFKNVKKIIQKKELNFFIDPLPCQYNMYHISKNDRLDFFNNNFDIIDGDNEIFKGVEVISTPGHTPGSQSVIVNCKEVTYCISGDIVCIYDNILKIIPPGIHTNLFDCYESLNKIKNRSDVVLPSHDLAILKDGILKL